MTKLGKGVEVRAHYPITLKIVSRLEYEQLLVSVC